MKNSEYPKDNTVVLRFEDGTEICTSFDDEETAVEYSRRLFNLFSEETRNKIWDSKIIYGVYDLESDGWKWLPTREDLS